METVAADLPMTIVLSWEQEQFLRDLHDLYPDEGPWPGNGVRLKENRNAAVFGGKWTLTSE